MTVRKADELLDKFIASMSWSEEATEDLKAIVIGNLRGYSILVQQEFEYSRIVQEDLSMIVRMMVTKHRRGKLDEEYCQKVMDYLQCKGLQGNVLRGLCGKDENETT